uniref:UDP-glucuronosyltransferase n=1 Tax=Oncorhynchus kisutch TaxID=8019 RepID=A0A8C7GJ36_ONCKI
DLQCRLLPFTPKLYIIGCIDCGNILVRHTEGSHWINLKPVLETLLDRGHNVTVLVNSASLYIDPTEHSRFSYQPFNGSVSVEDCLEEFIHFSMYEMDHLYYWQIHWRLDELIQRQIQLNMQIVDGLLKSESIMERLREAKYELLLADPIWHGSELVVEMLGLPLVYTFLYRPHQGEALWAASGLPFYVPSDMTIYSLWRVIDDSYSDPTTTCAMIGNPDLWLVRIHCKTAKLLPEALEEFVQSSGDHGIVVGSMIRNMTTELADMIASALGQIPQSRHSEEKPETLAPNTRVYNRIPQNDLLGSYRFFITKTIIHYYDIYNGVPMVVIPMFADQPDNMIHMKAKGAAVIMDFLQTWDLVDGLNAVINNPSFRENAMRLSRIHYDRPLSPKDEALFWLEFTMRNRGDRLLRFQAHQLTWYQYHSLDVLALLLAVVLLLTLLFIKTGFFCIRSCCYGTKFKSKAE